MKKTVSFLILGMTLLNSLGRGPEGARANSILLNGAWEFVVGHGGEGAEDRASQRCLLGADHSGMLRDREMESLEGLNTNLRAAFRGSKRAPSERAHEVEHERRFRP